MNSKIFITIPLLFLLLLSCGNVNDKQGMELNQGTTLENQDLKEKLEKINSEIGKLVLAGNYDALMPYYTDDAIISPGFGPSIKGKKAIREAYEKNKKEGLKYHSFSGTPEEIWECEKFVYDRGTFGLAVSAKDHPKPVAYYGSYFTIWQKEDNGSLKVKYLIWNLDFNPCED
jgi:ketosteroid isomerase-like protein